MSPPDVVVIVIVIVAVLLLVVPPLLLDEDAEYELVQLRTLPWKTVPRPMVPGGHRELANDDVSQRLVCP